MTHPAESHYLAPLFEPASIAIVGASERRNAVGAVAFSNLLASYKGEVFAVNPRHRTISGRRSYASVTEIPQRVDLAVIATPPPTVPGIIEDCGRAGVRTAVVITSGFPEMGAEG